MTENDTRLVHDWLEILIAETSKSPLDNAALMKCADAHYRILNMEETLRPMKGNLEKLIAYLRTTMGWIVQHDVHNRIILADEAKPECVCPLRKAGLIEAPLLCECSRGFASQMFGYVVEHEVKTEIVRSILRGATSCVYKVTY
jgi:hypothetical protein